MSNLCSAGELFQLLSTGICPIDPNYKKGELIKMNILIYEYIIKTHSLESK
jgi:hypothetical protein